MSVKINKNILTISLMASSICLLMLLQVFWINREYKNAEQTFRKESNLVFQNTIHAFMESHFQTSIQLDSIDLFNLPDDPAYFRKTLIRTPYRGKPPGSIHPDEISDIVLVLKERMRHVRIASVDKITGRMESGDAISYVKLPLLDSIHAPKTKRRFMIRFDPDSLNIDSLSEKLGTQLKGINRDLKFKVIKKFNEEGEDYDTTSFVTEFVKINPHYQYAASFEDVNMMLVKEIIPQITFSAFLSLLTIGAFLILYKNLLIQQNLVRQKNEFISNVTHELKTPVATVSVALEALKNFNALENPKRTEEYLDLAQNELKRLSMMTDKILNTSIFDSKGFAAEQLDLQMLMLQVIDSMKLVWEKQKAIVHTNVEGDNFILTSNKIHLSNVIYNLLDNAVKYSKAPANINIILKDEGHQLVLTVKDHGIGIPEEYKKKVFDKFFRVPQGDVHNVKGYGLGLSYVLQVIKAHKGRVEVKSEAGKGSSFSIKLPKYGSH